MALSKPITSEEGFTTNYHKVRDVSLRDNRLSCNINSYVSKEYRDLDRPANRSLLFFSVTVEEEESMGIRQLAYKKIKELDNWADAVDC